MGAYDGGVDDQVLKVRIVRQRRENPMPHTFAAPAAKASEDAIPLAERRRQIAPRRAGAHDPKHTFHEHPVVAASGAALVRASDDQTRDPLPLPIAQNKPLRPQGCLPKSSLESRFDRFENPKSPQDLASEQVADDVAHLVLGIGLAGLAVAPVTADHLVERFDDLLDLGPLAAAARLVGEAEQAAAHLLELGKGGIRVVKNAGDVGIELRIV